MLTQWLPQGDWWGSGENTNRALTHIAPLVIPKSPLVIPALPVPVRVTHDAVIVHRYTYAPPRCRTSPYHRTFIPWSVSLWNDLSDAVFDGVGLAGFKSRANAFLLAHLLAHFLSLAIFPFSSFILWVGVVGLGSSD